MTMEHPREKAARLSHVMHESALIMARAANTFKFLSRIIEDGDYDEPEHVADVAALASMALAGFSEKHDQEMTDVHAHLRALAEVESAKWP